MKIKIFLKKSTSLILTFALMTTMCSDFTKNILSKGYEWIVNCL